MILNYYGLMVNSLNTHIPNNLRNMCVISNSKNMFVWTGLDLSTNILCIIFIFFCSLTQTIRGAAASRMGTIIIRRCIFRIIRGIYWTYCLPSSASYPSNSKNILSIFILIKLSYIFCFVTQSIRGAAASSKRHNYTADAHLIDCPPPQKMRFIPFCLLFLCRQESRFSTSCFLLPYIQTEDKQ